MFFFDFTSIPSGDFEQIIIGNIKARAHFVLILTPTALNRCDQPGDWLRREIETAINEQRNIVPLFFEGFNFGTPSISKKLTGTIKALNKYNGLEVPSAFFDEAMGRLRNQFLDVELDTVLHPVSAKVHKAVKEQQLAANKAVLDGKEELQKVETVSLDVGQGNQQNDETIETGISNELKLPPLKEAIVVIGGIIGYLASVILSFLVMLIIVGAALVKFPSLENLFTIIFLVMIFFGIVFIFIVGPFGWEVVTNWLAELLGRD